MTLVPPFFVSPMITRQHSRWAALMYTCVVLYFLCNLQKVVAPGCIFDLLQADYDAPPSQIAAISSAMMLTYAFMQPVMGMLAPRFSATRLTFYGLISLAIGGLGSAFAPSLWILYLCRVLVGIGAGSVGFSITLDTVMVFQKNQGIILGAFLMVGFAGLVCGGVPVLLLSQYLGSWRYAFALIAGITLVAAIVWMLIYRKLELPQPEPEVLGRKIFDLNLYRQTFKNRQNIFFFCNVPVAYGIVLALTNVIGAKFLHDYCQMDPKTAGSAVSGVQLVACFSGIALAAISKAVGGRLSFFQKLSATVNFTALAIMMLAVLCHVRQPALYIALIAVMTAMVNMTPLLVAFIQKTNPPLLLSPTFAVFNFCVYFWNAVFGYIMGRVLNCFTPAQVNNILVYPEKAYLGCFIFLVAFVTVCLVQAHRLKKV